MLVADKITKIENARINTASMLRHSKDLASWLCLQLTDLGISELLKGKYSVKEIKSSIRSDDYLFMHVGTEYQDLDVLIETANISATREEAYMYSDYNASFNMPNRSDILEFVADLPAILDELANLQDPTDTLEKICELLHE